MKQNGFLSIVVAMLLQSPLVTGGDGRLLMKAVLSSWCDVALDGAVADMMTEALGQDPDYLIFSSLLRSSTVLATKFYHSRSDPPRWRPQV
ncbi:hypothetical protein HPB52_001418 [Rhipicephalus sanguineus]|uniref:Secreted protein n=1 Tax=Rhipicephalus sanguineus TaxID=34632 RepID=A0A9D4P9V1_RHISA|nr:hypothetical protein HPB52_001418 [Rhipicephalus sanguineus]